MVLSNLFLIYLFTLSRLLFTIKNALYFYLWNIGQQHIAENWQIMYCCELLSDCIFEISVNNLDKEVPTESGVVNCFQIVSLKYRSTTVIEVAIHCVRLWIAFRLYLWNIGQQPILVTKTPVDSCELLSDCIFEISVNNIYLIKDPVDIVVNCFQIVSLKYRSTTKKS